MSAWPPERIAALKALHAAGLTFLEIAARLGVSRQAIGGAVRRHVHEIAEAPSERHRGRVRATLRARHDLRTEAWLTEPWAVRKARRALEKATAKTAGA